MISGWLAARSRPCREDGHSVASERALRKIAKGVTCMPHPDSCVFNEFRRTRVFEHGFLFT